ncbi:MAG TPA: GAF domain-containing protein [Verrucomicrobiae bacterium]|nr:GAF domain-containing protein [Verrucomicrobiae bacterium]
MLKIQCRAATSPAEPTLLSISAAPLLALGVEGWGISDTLRVAGAGALIFVAALAWVVVLKLRTHRQNLLLKTQLQREKALSELGRKLAVATTVAEAARIILDSADYLFGWDAAYLNLYAAEPDVLTPVINLDTVDGKRGEVPFGYPAGKPTPMAREIIDNGPKLIRRTPHAASGPPLLPFGDKGRLSASLMFVPIHGGSEVIGLISIQSYTAGLYDEEKLAVLQGLADHCGGALERIQARAELHKSLELLEGRVAERTEELTRINGLLHKGREELEQLVEERTVKLTKAVGALEQEIAVRREAEARSAAFSRLGEQLSAAADFAAAGRTALDAADELLGWDASYLHLYTPDYHFTIPVLSFDIVDGKRTQVFWLYREVSPRDKRIIERGAELVSGAPSGTQPPFVPFGVRSRPTASRLFVPIHSAGRVIGAMSAQSYTANAYTPKDLALLQSLADFCGGTLERIQAEQSLRQSEERFSKVFRSSPAPMSLSTLEQGIYLDVNDSLANMLGYEREEMIGRTSIELGIWPDPEDRVRMAEQILKLKSLRNYQCQVRRKNGEVRTALASVERMDIRGEQNVLLATFHDITEWLSLEAQLRQSQKMEAIGQLAAGVAHDFNNILTIIQGHVGLLMDEPTVGDDVRESLQPVATAADRAAALTRQLLAFSRKQVMQMRVADLNDIVSDAANMLQRLLGETVVLSFSYSPAPATIEGDAGMLEQVIINLAVNARDAMPDGGRLRVMVERVEVERAAARQRTEADTTSFVRLTMADDGRGMDEPTKARIFEPFFTTKDVGKGTGLGLATVYGIIKQHAGWIDVESAPGQGTVFRIFVPASSAPPPPPAPRKIKEPVKKAEPAKAPAPARGGGETILVVEDELDLRDLVHALLESFGYRVLEAEHGKDALEVWRRAGGKIDLLLTDVTMPEGISGIELAERFRQEKPDLKVIFSSGYSVELFERQKIAGLKEGLNFLPKPYQPETLAKTVRMCLDS